ncbi:AAA family ATPase [Candidatus Giovannonibacteria bacterium]|nr:AAA family ATPase [Candidatus Giovannonibacteria bacterium]
MLFTRLEINGFKSFAKAVELEFPSHIAAIVGPNGSGKSNVADSIRWVLGEQSMKSLRGKKGEDLIFGGSPHVPRLGKASVSLVFNNNEKVFPLEFKEVIMSRTVYRDGVNEYKLNNSPVRLKDIIELLSKVGLGASQHHIIAQGDSDRILYSSPTERKSMIEEALGLKIFELKKAEAERKLASTEANIKNVESLRREIQPHLKYLNSQAEKMKNAAELRRSLEELSREYVARELVSIKTEEEEIKKAKEPLQKKMRELEEAVSRSEKIMAGDSDTRAFFEELKKLDHARDAILKRRSEIEREIGRMEGEAARKEKPEGPDTVSKQHFRDVLKDILSDLETASNSGSMDTLRNYIFETVQKIYSILETLSGGAKEKSAPSAEETVPLGKFKEELKALEEEENNILRSKRSLEERHETSTAAIQKEGISYRELTSELARARDELRSLEAREERWHIQKNELEVDFHDRLGRVDAAGEVFSPADRAQLRRKIERARILLEEAGGVDEGVIKEYDETAKRDEFLAKELDDLKKAASQMGEMLQELQNKIEKDFTAGVGEINKLFSEFFHEIFGGGKASLKIMEPKKPVSKNEDGGEDWEGEEEVESGLDIIVDIPRKRIRSLNMLSGGERALTSIALLFAVSTVNPPPFLVLDETDAALDEANSNRYGSMLKELSKRTQLIVVSHNRETMKCADVLYGVTMGPDGISRLLSVKLEDASVYAK